MNKKNLTIGIISIVGIFIFLFGVYYLINTPKKTVFPEINKILSTDQIKWSKKSKNLLIEYSDFQCPACKVFHEYMKNEIEASNSSSFTITEKTAFIFRHFPLYQIHPNAFESAYAVEAAGRQGKFYEMADLLFARQDQWPKEKNSQEAFIKLATELKLDLEKFKKDLSSKEIKDKVDADLKSGEKAEINSTPTFFLNGEKLAITSLEDLKKILQNL